MGNDKRMKTSFILVFLIILGHFGQASSKDKKSQTKSTVKKFLKRTLGESKSQTGSQKEKKRGKILFRSDGSSAISVESENKQFLEIVTEKIPTGLDKKYLSCETMKKLCVDYYGGHCTDDGEKCCELDACIVCYAGWSGPTCNIRKGTWQHTQNIWHDSQCPNIGILHKLDVDECKSTCRAINGCTAINYGPGGLCALRACSRPIPTPEWIHDRYEGYYLKSGTWQHTHNIWHDSQCPNIGILHKLDVDECKSKCRAINGCTAINYGPGGFCALRACSRPIPTPEWV